VTTRRLAFLNQFATAVLSTGCHGSLRHRIRSCWGCGGCAPGFEAGYAAEPVGYGYGGPAAAPAPGCSSCYGGAAPVAATPAMPYGTPMASPYATPLPVPPGPPNVFQTNEPPKDKK
jgi:hypothetical protein